jgi:hypothetical protein
MKPFVSRACLVCVTIGLILGVAANANAKEGHRAGEKAAGLSARARAVRVYRDDRDLGERPHRLRRFKGGRPRVETARESVVGGALTTIGQVPWQVAVLAEFEYEGEEFAELCGGAIIDVSHVVTAGHCAMNPFTGNPLPAGSFVVLAGASRITVEEIEDGATVEGRLVAASRVHPDFDYAAGPGTPDDIAVLQLEHALLTSSGVQPIGLPASPVGPLEGGTAVLSGFGVENPRTSELNGSLYSLEVSLGVSRECGGDADAVFLCGASPDGSACNGDSGSGLTEELEGSETLIGIVDTVQVIDGERCRDGSVDGFVNLAAPEIRDFVEGSEDPPVAPRGGSGVAIRGVPMAGETLTCEPGSWSNASTYAFEFINSASGQVLQKGPASTYLLTDANVGMTISCLVEATNAGGTGTNRTAALRSVEAAPSPPPPSGGGGSNSGGSGGGSSNGASGGSGSQPGGTGEGAVEAYKQSHVASSQIADLLRSEIVPHGKSALVKHVLDRGGCKLAVKALESGVEVIDWYLPSKGARSGGKSRGTLVATGQIRFSGAGRGALNVKLTSAGKRLLSDKQGVKLVAWGSFAGSEGKPVVVNESFTMRR